MPEIHAQDFVTIGLLVFLEGVLSIDNALALALIARGLPKHLQKKALTYGLIGAVVFRITALALAEHLMQWNWVKFVGGGYLVYMALSHWFLPKKEEHSSTSSHAASFWKAVVLIELTDIAFAADSILAAVALSPKLWIVVTGGILGLIAMRFAAHVFITLLDRFPNFELTAYVLVLVVGLKLLIDGFKFEGVNFHSSDSPAFWAFWALMVMALIIGFVKPRTKKEIAEEKKALREEDRAIDSMEQN